METVLITGGTGMIGTGISKVLIQKDYHVIVLTRNPTRIPHQVPGVQYAKWDMENGFIEKEAFARANHIIHFAGANVGSTRWTKKRKLEIIDSRVRSGKLLADAIQNMPNKVRTLLSASAIGWYGPDPVIPNPAPFTEELEAYGDFLGQTCKLWESVLDPIEKKGIRLLKFRTGMVLSPRGGALKEFLMPLKFRVATVLGNGKQIHSWIHEEDLYNLYIKAIRTPAMQGVYNAVAPQHVSNRDFIKTLARLKYGKGYILFRVPALLLKIVFGELSIEVLKSATVSSDRLQSTGFEFKYRSIKDALANILNQYNELTH